MKKAFTLIEILIVITIMGTLTTMASVNFIETLKKSRDSKRKMDLANIQRGLEIYYEDEKRFPANITFGSKLCKTPSCTGGEKIYMQIIPNDPSNTSGRIYHYTTNSGGTYYKLYSTIENTSDTGQGVSQGGYASTDCGGGALCKYGVASSNTLP